MAQKPVFRILEIGEKRAIRTEEADLARAPTLGGATHSTSNWVRKNGEAVRLREAVMQQSRVVETDRRSTEG
jgi:hypothetical protein